MSALGSASGAGEVRLESAKPAKRLKQGSLKGGMDFSRYQSRYIALHVMYLGHKYYGLASTATALDTVEVRRSLCTFKLPA